MRKGILRFTMCLLVAILVAPVPGFSGKGRVEPAKRTNSGYIKKFQVTAVEGKIHPATIQVRRGDRISITFTSKDGHYGILIKEFGIKKHIRKDEKVTLELVATEKGVFPFRCTKQWGFKRWANNGKIVVK